MLIQSVRVLRGPNLWFDEPAIEATLDLCELADEARFRERAHAALPAVVAEKVLQQAPAAQDAGARRPGVVVVTALARLSVLFQPRVDARWGEVQLVSSAEANTYRFAMPFAEEAVGQLSLERACQVIAACLTDEAPPDFAQAAAELHALDAAIRLGPSTNSIVQAALNRGIPIRRLTEGSLVQLGQGSRAHRIWAAETDQTSALGEAIAQDKELTKTLLHRAFLPVPAGVVVGQRDKAWANAQRIGLPVVIKPRKGNQGRGVSVDLTTQQAVEAAFDVATALEPEVLLEKHIVGNDYRLLVIGGKLIAAAHREPPKVEGDGVRTIKELVALENDNPLRGEGHNTVLSKIPLDAIALETLKERGLDVDSVVPAGDIVWLRRNGNLSTGGTATDVTDSVHPLVARAAVQAAQVVGLDIAGIDLVAPNVTTPLSESGGAFVEVNAAPGLRMHLEPSHGKGRPVGEAIVESLFPKRDSGRVPVVSVTGTNGKTTTTRIIAHLLRQRRLRVGMTCTDGVFIDQRRIDSGDCSGPKSARSVLSHPHVDAAVLETARGGILREGLGFDWCDVAVVTNVGEGDHLGMGGIETAEDLARVKCVPVRRVGRRGVAVLNAADPLVAAMARQCGGEVLFFAADSRCPALVAHRAAGGWVATVRSGELVIERGSYSCRLGQTHEFPLTHRGRVGFQVENLLSAAAAGFWLGLTQDELRAGLLTFPGDLVSAPGRFNVLSHEGGTIVLDYGHNVSALRALAEGLRGFNGRRNTVVYTAAGDRRDQDIVEQGLALGEFFDEVVTYEDQCRRGRAPGEVTRLLREGIAGSTRRVRVSEFACEMDAIHAALQNLRRDDVLLCQVDQVDLALEFVTQWLTSQQRSTTADSWSGE